MSMEFTKEAIRYGSGEFSAVGSNVDYDKQVIALYDQHFDFVWRSLRRLGVQSGELDDALQDVFVVVHRKLKDFEERSTRKTWIFGIAVRVAKAYRRRVSRQRCHVSEEDSLLVCSGGTPEEAHARMQAAQSVQELLEGLDDDKRAVFVLAELEHVSAPEIAEGLGIPMNTVYSRLRLARAEFEAGLARLKAKDEWRLR